MKYEKFAEYLDRNNKLKAKADVKVVADFEGPIEAKPGKEKKHKDAGGKGQEGEIKPYKGGSDAKDPNKGKMGDGFAHKGDKALKYEPKIEKEHKKVATWPKTKTQEWIDGTAGMSLAEFTKSIRESSIQGVEGFQPTNSIRETVQACKNNGKYISDLVREMKRNGLFEKFTEEMAQHPETFSALARLMEDDETYARKFAKALSEMVAPPIGMEGDEEDQEMKPKKKPMPGEEDGAEDMEDHDDEETGEEHDDEEEGHDDEEPKDEVEPMPKKHAHDHLLNAMKGQPAISANM